MRGFRVGTKAGARAEPLAVKLHQMERRVVHIGADAPAPQMLEGGRAVDVQPLELEAEGDAEATEKAAVPEETILRCTECEYSAPRSEFVPENYR